ncbi:MAG: HDOD domain-containing protein [Thermodesulfobacteriota bacterium]
MTAIQDLMADIKRLSPIPRIALQCMELIESDKASLQGIADLISYDPMISAELLRLCNSAYMGLTRHIESVQDAVTYLGLHKVVDLLMLQCGRSRLEKPQPGYELERGELWRHSAASALMARMLAESKKSTRTHLIFTSALLKDIGKVLIDRYVHEDFIRINRLVAENGFSFREAEKEVIGMDHAELGGLIARQWNFSPPMIAMIRHHHQPLEAGEAADGAMLVYVAETICLMMGIGVGADGLAYRFYREVLDRLEITPRDVQLIIADFGERLNEIDNMLGTTSKTAT